MNTTRFFWKKIQNLDPEAFLILKNKDLELEVLQFIYFP